MFCKDTVFDQTYVINLLYCSVFSYVLSIYIMLIENRNSLFLKDIKETIMLTPFTDRLSWGSFSDRWKEPC